MSRLGELLLLTLTRFAPSSLDSEIVAVKESTTRFSRWEYGRAADVVRVYGPAFNLQGRHVLDLGTGLGGKLAYYQQLEPASITTVDIRPDYSEAARDFLHANGNGIDVQFVNADAANLPFDDATFDVVISNETFEHIKQPLLALQEVARVTRPQGWIFISFPPYYAPWGAHLNNWIALPWVQVFFSEQTLINVVVRLEEELQVNQHLIPEARVDLRGRVTLPHINKMTLRRFESLHPGTSLRLVRQVRYGPGWRRRPPYHRWVQVLTRVPVLREVFTSHAVYVFQK